MQQVKIVGIIQARLGSTRLPYKMLLSLHGHPIIKWVVCRASKSKRLNALVVAIPDTAENDLLESYLHKLKADVFRGTEDDVLKRFYLSAKERQATHIVRICADRPLISSEAIDHLIEFYFADHCDYAYNHIPMDNTYPYGLGAEIISFDLLEYLEKNAIEPEHREHCFSYITDHPDHFSIKTFDPVNKRIACPDLKLDIDTFEDFRRLSLKDFEIDTPAEDIVEMFKERL